MMKKIKINSTPRRKRMTREQRLQSAAATRFWEASGVKNIVRHYARWFGVDLLCAITELRLIGVAVSSEYEDAVRKTIADAFERKLQERQKSDEFNDYDEHCFWPDYRD